MTKTEIRIKREALRPRSRLPLRHTSLGFDPGVPLSLSPLLLLSILAAFLPACDPRPSTSELVLYTSVDEPIARPVIDEFTRQTGIRVAIVTDTEASKSVGLAERLRAEKARPRADVWWGNEPFHTINLAGEGMFQPYESPAAADVPAMFRDPQHRWAGNGLRARVFITTAHDSSVVFSMEELARSGFAMARPGVGTAAGHVASLYVAWGDGKADQFFRDLRASGTKLLGGNGPVAEAVARGEFAVGLTDNDDVENVRALNESVRMVPAWLGPDDRAAFLLPTTVALVAGRPESAEAKQLVDHLLSPAVEQKLIEARFAGWSIRGGGADQPKAMQVDYAEVARRMPEAVRRATAILEGREP